jgi:hypothetical protein
VIKLLILYNIILGFCSVDNISLLSVMYLEFNFKGMGTSVLKRNNHLTMGSACSSHEKCIQNVGWKA